MPKPWLRLSVILLLALLTRILLAAPVEKGPYPKVEAPKRAPAVLSLDSEEIKPLMTEADEAASPARVAPKVSATAGKPAEETFRAPRTPGVSRAPSLGTTPPSGRAISAAPVSVEKIATGTAVEEGYFISMGTGMAVVDKYVGWIMSWGALGRIDEDWPVYVGADIGVHYWRSSPSMPSANLTGIQILGSSVYQFRGDSFLRPYVGISFGPFLRNAEKGLTTSAVLLARPGILFTVSEIASLGLEPRFGLFEGSFVLEGQANAVFSL